VAEQVDNTGPVETDDAGSLAEAIQAIVGIHPSDRWVEILAASILALASSEWSRDTVWVLCEVSSRCRFASIRSTWA
jgi:hypothetical protein